MLWSRIITEMPSAKMGSSTLDDHREFLTTETQMIADWEWSDKGGNQKNKPQESQGSSLA